MMGDSIGKKKLPEIKKDFKQLLLNYARALFFDTLCFLGSVSFQSRGNN